MVENTKHPIGLNLSLDLPFDTSTPLNSPNSTFSQLSFNTLLDSSFEQDSTDSTIQLPLIMDSTNMPSFSGLTHENPERFLSEFQSYSVLRQLPQNGDTSQKVAALHLQLRGPASSYEYIGCWITAETLG